MKALENDTDRQAEVHLHVEGKVEPLAEYGEYIDPSDNAICCYVPIEEGHQVKIRGHFSGTVSGQITVFDTYFLIDCNRHWLLRMML
jgi:hypothetical protein